MIRTTEVLEKALSTSHAPAVTAEVWAGRVRLGRVEVGDGNVTQSASQFQRRSGTVEVRATNQAREWLATPGACLRVWRGVQGVPGRMPVLWGPARAPRRALWSSSVEVSVECLSRRVIRDEFPSPRQSAPGATVAQQSLTLWRESVPWCTWDDDTRDSTAVPAMAWESDRAGAISELVASIGCESWMRPDGKVVLRRVPTVTQQHVHAIAQGSSLSTQALVFDWDAVANHVVVRSDSPDNPIVGEYIDWDSPTGITACGRRTRRISTATVTTVAQATIAAKSYVLRSQGARISVEVEAIAHPGIEASDVVLIRSDLGSRRFVVDTVEQGLRAAGMTLTGRVPSAADSLDEDGAA